MVVVFGLLIASFILMVIAGCTDVIGGIIKKDIAMRRFGQSILLLSFVPFIYWVLVVVIPSTPHSVYWD